LKSVAWLVVVKTKIALRELLLRKDVGLHKIYWTLLDSEITWRTVSYSNSSFR